MFICLLVFQFKRPKIFNRRFNRRGASRIFIDNYSRQLLYHPVLDDRGDDRSYCQQATGEPAEWLEPRIFSFLPEWGL